MTCYECHSSQDSEPRSADYYDAIRDVTSYLLNIVGNSTKKEIEQVLRGLYATADGMRLDWFMEHMGLKNYDHECHSHATAEGPEDAKGVI